MKKILSIIMATVMLVTLVSCGLDDKSKQKEPEDETEMVIDYTEKTYKAKDIADKIKLTGRSGIGDDGIHLDWTWASASFHGWFDGEIKADFTLGYGWLGEILVVVDGDFENANKLIINTKDILGIENSENYVNATLCTVEKGEHTITIYKNSQGINGGANIENITFVGQLGDKPANGKLKIEIIGDSISCGAGALGESGRGEGAADDSYYSYGAILSRELEADVSVVAVSGWGLASGGGNAEAIIPNLYDETSYFRNKTEKWNFADNQVDLVIISLGTNDYALANAGKYDEFSEKAAAFLGHVRENYPNAEIFWIYGQMLNQYNVTLDNMVDDFGDDHVHYFDVVRNVAGGYGHPDKDGHIEYAEFLNGKINEFVK